MASISKHSTKAEIALRAQLLEQQNLVKELLLKNPAFSDQATKLGKGETIHAPTAGSSALRKEYNRLLADNAQIMGDLNNPAALANRIPMGVDEAVEQYAQRISGADAVTKVKTFGQELNALNKGTPIQQAQALLIKGGRPQLDYEALNFPRGHMMHGMFDGPTLRSLFPGAHTNVELLAELMERHNLAKGKGGISFESLADIKNSAGADTTARGIAQTLTGPQGGPINSVDQAGSRADQLSNHYDEVADKIERNRQLLAESGTAASNRITRTRSNATIAGVMGGVVVGGGGYLALRDPPAIDKFNKRSGKTLFGGGGADGPALSSKDPIIRGNALNAAFAHYISREFGDKGSTMRSQVAALEDKHEQTFRRLAAGTLRPSKTETDAAFNSLVADLGKFFSGTGYNADTPIVVGYSDDDGNPSALSIDKTGQFVSKLNDEGNFDSIGE